MLAYATRPHVPFAVPVDDHLVVGLQVEVEPIRTRDLIQDDEDIARFGPNVPSDEGRLDKLGELLIESSNDPLGTIRTPKSLRRPLRNRCLSFLRRRQSAPHLP